MPGYLLVPQAWTLQIELLFYLVVPFLFRLRKKTFTIFTLAYLAVFFGYVIPFNVMPKTLFYSFLSYLIFFLLGTASYRFLYKYWQKNMVSKKVFWIIFIFFISYLLFYNYIPIYVSAQYVGMDNPIYYLALSLLMPLFFINTNKSRLDNIIGNLSYPVYVLHLIVVKLFSNIPEFFNPSAVKTILIIITSMFMSILATKFIENPINKIRQARLRNC
jgi:peptidoglycan/LPS O-acetylase OafA/YrhL